MESVRCGDCVSGGVFYVPDLRSLCGPEGITLLFIAVVFAIFWSRVMRLPSGVDYVPQSLPPIPRRSDTLYAQIFEPTPPPPRSMSCMLTTVARLRVGRRGFRKCRAASFGPARRTVGRWNG